MPHELSQDGIYQVIMVATLAWGAGFSAWWLLALWLHPRFRRFSYLSSESPAMMYHELSEMRIRMPNGAPASVKRGGIESSGDDRESPPIADGDKPSVVSLPALDGRKPLDNTPANGTAPVSAAKSSQSTQGTDVASMDGEDRPVHTLPLFTVSERADFCSRINSTIHSFIIVPGFLAAIVTNEWKENFEVADNGDIAPMQALLSVSAGYFFFDLVAVPVFRMPLWGVFVAHHMMALVCLCGNLFFPHCRYGTTFGIAVFLFVEFSNVSLNIQTFALQAGYCKRSKIYTIAFYATFIGWIFVRFFLPLTIVPLLIDRVFLTVPVPQRLCFLPTLVASISLSLFCVGVFISVLIPEMYRRWRKPPKEIEEVLAIVNESISADGKA